MNTLVKITAGFTATAAGVLALTVLRNRKNKEQQDALDRNTYRKTENKSPNQELHQEKTKGNFITDHGNTALNDSTPVNYTAPVQKVQHHQKGVRHH